MEEKQVIYRHAVLQGTYYECGRQLGAQILSHSPEERALFAELRPGQTDLSAAEQDALFAANDKYFPGINEEMRGLADALSILPGRLAATLMWQSQSGCCSHIAVLPGASANGHVLAARSYEWSMDDALRLVTTRVTGRYAHIGFSIFACGRFDGINEKGLCVTMSAGAPGMQPEAKGFMFWAGIRTALDTCATVDEALAVITAPPSCTCDIILLSDRQGNAVLIENDRGHRAIKRISAGSPEQYLYAANHYTLPAMAGHGNQPMWMSTARTQRMDAVLSAAAPRIGSETLMGLLSAKVPDGLCCHHYNEWFGTLWSMLFDVTDGTVRVCFGSPAANGWHTFGLNDPPGLTEYPAVMPIEPCADPAFFSRPQ